MPRPGELLGFTMTPGAQSAVEQPAPEPDPAAATVAVAPVPPMSTPPNVAPVVAPGTSRFHADGRDTTIASTYAGAEPAPGHTVVLVGDDVEAWVRERLYGGRLPNR